MNLDGVRWVKVTTPANVSTHNTIEAALEDMDLSDAWDRAQVLAVSRRSATGEQIYDDELVIVSEGSIVISEGAVVGFTAGDVYYVLLALGTMPEVTGTASTVS